MALRVQLSLVLTDEDLYNGLVKPYKDCRELSPLIIKLLSSYYYDEGIRASVEGASSDSLLTEDVQEQTSFNEAAKRARETLAMMNIMMDEASDVLADGVDDIMSKVNDIAVATGGTASEETGFGVSVPCLGTAKVKSLKQASTEPTKVVNDIVKNNEAIVKEETGDVSKIVAEQVDKVVAEKMSGVTDRVLSNEKSLDEIKGMLQLLLGGSQKNTSEEEVAPISDTAVTEQGTSVGTEKEPVVLQSSQEQEQVINKVVEIGQPVAIESANDLNDELDGSDEISAFLSNGVSFTDSF